MCLSCEYHVTKHHLAHKIIAMLRSTSIEGRRVKCKDNGVWEGRGWWMWGGGCNKCERRKMYIYIKQGRPCNTFELLKRLLKKKKEKKEGQDCNDGAKMHLREDWHFVDRTCHTASRYSGSKARNHTCAICINKSRTPLQTDRRINAPPQAFRCLQMQHTQRGW